MKKFLLTLVLICILKPMIAQETDLYVPLNLQRAYKKETRSTDGQPGKNYWQNKAAYKLKITFDPKKLLVKGIETITYHNLSPDTLKKIVFKLDMNLYKKDAKRMVDIAAEDESDGIKFSKFTIDGVKMDTSKYVDDGTILTAKTKPIAPGSSVSISIVYSYTLNKKSHYRTGMIDKGSYFIAYSFPRIAVYDDTKGWDTNPYIGTHEFYNDFCDFTVDVVVPDRYVVWATGDLQNSKTLFQKPVFNKLQNAERGDNIIGVIMPKDLKEKAVVVKRKQNTWKFKASNVTDFAFAVSNHFIWQATSIVVNKETGRRTRVDAVYDPNQKDFQQVCDIARKTVEGMSYYFPKWPFPYSHITVFQGLDQMEYPMMVNDNPMDTKAETITLTDHEIMHTMFPFYMGTNENKYAWMDEGWATLGEWLISKYIDSTLIDDYGMDRTNLFMGSEYDAPIMTLTNQTMQPVTFINNYPKPALGYLYIKDMLGDELFYTALHHYIKTWAGKHPMPYDFFNCMNIGSGQNMNWFYKNWWFESGYADLSVGTPEKTDSTCNVAIMLKGNKFVPVDLEIEYADGSKDKIYRSIAVWKEGQKSILIDLPPAKTVKRITLGSLYIPDAFPKDNVYYN